MAHPVTALVSLLIILTISYFSARRLFAMIRKDGKIYTLGYLFTLPVLFGRRNPPA